jgi:hypothetical protein
MQSFAQNNNFLQEKATQEEAPFWK